MGKLKKKGESGAATAFISRARAIRKLQLTLGDFRRLCILKGIYPREPRNKKKAGHGSNEARTYYFTKDIQFLAHEPLMDKFREFKAFVKKIRRARGRGEHTTVKHLQTLKPTFSFDHLVRERYPSFVDALRDLDDALGLMFLFSQLPTDRLKQATTVGRCRRLCTEFMHYLIESRSLRKVFLSVKGIYYQAEIMGQTITWLTPYQFCTNVPVNIDFQVMEAFGDFYMTLLKFVNYRLYQSLNLTYPPKVQSDKEEDGLVLGALIAERTDLGAVGNSEPIVAGKSASKKEVAAAVAAVSGDAEKEDDKADEEAQQEQVGGNDQEASVDVFPTPLGGADAETQVEEDDAALVALKNLFNNCWFFLNRETPLLSLEFVIRSFGGNVSWPGENQDGSGAGAGLFKSTDPRITHQIVDRGVLAGAKRVPNRSYVQPQWVYDCINAKRLLPVADYAPGAVLPPHLSPFVQAKQGEYVPEEALPEDERHAALAASAGAGEPEEEVLSDDALYEEELVAETKGETATEFDLNRKTRKSKNKTRAKDESTKTLAKIMMSKKNRNLYNRIEHSKAKTKEAAKTLKKKKAALASMAK